MGLWWGWNGEYNLWYNLWYNQWIPVVPARGGAEVALGMYYKTFLTYRTCMRRAPARPVRACILRKWCPVSPVRFEAPLRTSHFSLHSSHSTLHTSHSTLHTALFALHTSLHTALLRLHTSHSTLHTPHCFLQLVGSLWPFKDILSLAGPESTPEFYWSWRIAMTTFLQQPLQCRQKTRTQLQ